MATLVTDPDLERKARAARQGTDAEKWNEVWDGVLVIPPIPDNQHRDLVMGLCYAFCSVVNQPGGDTVLPGANVSDREAGWLHNYRVSDAVVYLAGTAARDLDTHWAGGPDFGVEVISRGEGPRAKLPFYAAVNSREILIVDRYPWSLELYRLQGESLVLAGRADPASPTALASAVLPLTFQLQGGTPRPTVLVTHPATGQTWVA